VQIDIAKLRRALDADALQTNRHGHIATAVVEQRCIFGRADQMPRRCPCFEAIPLVKIAQLGHGLLDHPTSNAHAAHQSPMAVNLAVFADCRVRKYMAPIHI
jgi:hypothetical protein